jgi:hypothetical protein
MLTPAPAPRWPTRDAYDAAMLDWHTTLADPELRAGDLARDSFGIRRYGGAGLYVCVYRIGDWLVRCFRANPPKQPPDDIMERYAAISAFCRAHTATLPALVPIDYQPEGITVHGQAWPIVKMPFLGDAVSLGSYISRHVRDGARMRALAGAWLHLIAGMEAAPMAHGDLDLTNVLVQGHDDAPTLRLIDYDNLWLPALQQRRQTESGHEHFQHPAFLPPNARPFGPAMDRFSALVIYLALLALIQQPTLYDEWEADESAYLLLLRFDYQRPTLPGGRIAYLRALPGLAPYADALVAALQARTMPPSIVTLAGSVPTAPVASPPPARIPRPAVDPRPRVMQFGPPSAPDPFAHLARAGAVRPPLATRADAAPPDIPARRLAARPTPSLVMTDLTRSGSFASSVPARERRAGGGPALALLVVIAVIVLLVVLFASYHH